MDDSFCGVSARACFGLYAMQRLLGQLLGARDRNAFVLVDDQRIDLVVAAVQHHARACAVGLDMHIGRA